MVGLPESGAGLPTWEHLVGAPHALRIQARLGQVKNPADPGHADSWGIGWFDQMGRPSALRQTGSAESSPSFVFAAELAARTQAGSGPASVLLGHLRKASCGAVTSENAHPIAVGPFFVIHNGTIYAPLLQTLRDDLAEAERPEARADSDTVVLATWLELKAKEGTDRYTALADALSELLLRVGSVVAEPSAAYTAINLLIAAPEGLYALRQFTKDSDYYTLSVHELASGGWIVASEPTDPALDWEALRPGVLEFFSAAGERRAEPTLVARYT